MEFWNCFIPIESHAYPVRKMLLAKFTGDVATSRTSRLVEYFGGS